MILHDVTDGHPAAGVAIPVGGVSRDDVVAQRHVLRLGFHRYTRLHLGEYGAGDDDWEENEPATHKRQSDTFQTIMKQAASPPCIILKGGEKPGNNEERGHPEGVDKGDQNIEGWTGLGIFIRPDITGRKGDVIHGSMQYQTQQHHRRSKAVERVIALERRLV